MPFCHFAERMTPAPQTQGNSTPASGSNETILVVEDEASLRGMVKLVLTRLGYKVIEASTGVEALELWKDVKDEVDLLFTDMALPDGLSGQQLAQELQKQRPELRVLFTSGYSTQALTQSGRLPTGAACVQKPYRPPVLGQAIRSLLDETPESGGA